MVGLALLVWPCAADARLDLGSWAPIGPAPTVNGSTTYTEPASGRIVGIAPDPSDPATIYVAAAGGGVWKTTDGGTSWTPLTDDQATLFMGAIAVAPSDPSVVYAGTGEANMGPSKARSFRTNIYPGRGVLKSKDGGASWQLLGEQEFARRTISRVVVDPRQPDTVYVAVGATATNGLSGNTGIWKSSDGGQTWTNTTTSISTTAAFSELVMDPGDPSVLYTAVGEPGGDAANGIFKTTDGGDSWVPAGDFPLSDPQLGRISLAIANSSSQTLYAAVARPGPPLSSSNSLYKIFKSDDGGATWSPLPNPGSLCPEEGTSFNYMAGAGDYHNVLAIDPTNPDVVYAAGLCLLRSMDGGASWEAVAEGETDGPHHDHHALAFDATGRLLDGNDGGIWQLSTGAPVTWANLNGDLQTTQFVGLALDPTSIKSAYGGTQDTGTIKYQGDPAWPRLLRGDGGASAVSSTDPSRIYQVTRIAATSPNIFRRSDDQGTSWSVKVSGIDSSDPKNFYPPMVVDPSDGNRVLLGTNRVYETTSAGDAWTPLSSPGTGGWTGSENIDAIAPAPSDPDTIYASAGGHIYASTDHGGSWQQRDVADAQDHFANLVVEPGNASTVYAVRDRFDGGHVFVSSDGGQSWTDISGDLPNAPVNAIALDPTTSPTTVYVGADDGVYYSADMGGHWAVAGMGLPHAQVTNLQLDPVLGVLAAGTHGRGAWELPLTSSARPRSTHPKPSVTARRVGAPPLETCGHHPSVPPPCRRR